jgi:hypothetical protein
MRELACSAVDEEPTGRWVIVAPLYINIQKCISSDALIQKCTSSTSSNSTSSRTNLPQRATWILQSTRPFLSKLHPSIRSWPSGIAPRYQRRRLQSRQHDNGSPETTETTETEVPLARWTNRGCLLGAMMMMMMMMMMEKTTTTTKTMVMSALSTLLIYTYS